MKKRIADIAFIILGAFFFALAVNLFVIPNEFGEGGYRGHDYFVLPVSVVPFDRQSGDQWLAADCRV